MGNNNNYSASWQILPFWYNETMETRIKYKLGYQRKVYFLVQSGNGLRGQKVLLTFFVVLKKESQK